MIRNDKLYLFNHGAKEMIHSNNYPMGGASWPNPDDFLKHAEDMYKTFHT